MIQYISRDTGEGTTEVIKVEIDNEGDIKETKVEEYDKEDGTPLEFNESNGCWEYPKSYFQENEDDN